MRTVDHDWLIEHLAAVIKWQVAYPDAGDGPDAPEVPIAGRRVWELFLALNVTRTSGGFGGNPISGAEIESYSRLAREPIRPWELEMLRALDVTYLKASREMAAPEGERPSSSAIMGAFRRVAGPRVSIQPLSMPLFDAVFGDDV